MATIVVKDGDEFGREQRRIGFDDVDRIYQRRGHQMRIIAVGAIGMCRGSSFPSDAFATDGRGM